MSANGVAVLGSVVLGFGGTILAIMGWIRWWHRDVAQLVRDNDADWAAFALIKVGARHVDGGHERPGSQPLGIIFVKDGVLGWRPNRAAIRKGHQNASWPLNELHLLLSRKQRLPTGVAIQLVHVRIKGEILVAWFYTDAGRMPHWLTGSASGAAA